MAGFNLILYDVFVEFLSMYRRRWANKTTGSLVRNNHSLYMVVTLLPLDELLIKETLFGNLSCTLRLLNNIRVTYTRALATWQTIDHARAHVSLLTLV